MSGRVRDLDPDALAALEEERDFLLRSLDDLEREFAAGDVDDLDYEALRDDYTARAASTIRAVEDGKARFAAARKPRSTARTMAVAGAVLIVAVVTGAVMAQAAGRRDAGDSLTGEINGSIRSQVNGCIASEASAADPIEVLECYDEVLSLDADNVQALTYRGWFLARKAFQAGEAGDELLDSAAVFLDEAIAADPGFADARVFRAVLHDRSGETEAALAQLDEFDQLDPPAQAKQLAAGLRERLEAESPG